jgi:hypothetical protein
MSSTGDGFALGASFMRNAGERGGTAVLWFQVRADGSVHVRVPRESMASVRPQASSAEAFAVSCLELTDDPGHYSRGRVQWIEW